MANPLSQIYIPSSYRLKYQNILKTFFVYIIIIIEKVYCQACTHNLECYST